MPDLIPAIGYVRVSMMREDAIAPETQQAVIGDWARRRGRTIVHWEHDLDQTGREFARRKITGIIAAIRDGTSPAGAREVAVWKFSRFGRNRYMNAVHLASLEDAGGRLHSATEEVDARTATGRFTRGMLLEVAAFESDRIAETWKEAYDHRVREGLPPLGRPRFGYARLGRVRDEDDPARTRRDRSDPLGERYVPDAALGAVLADMYCSYIDGDGGPVIGARLNGQGIPNTYGKRWSGRTVLDVLDSGFGAGLLRLHDPGCECARPGACGSRVWAQGKQEPVITAREWAAYRQRRDEVRTILPRHRNPVYPVSGLVRCGHCGGAVVVAATPEGGPVNFRCSRQRHTGDCPGGGATVPLSALLAAVRGFVSGLAADIDARAAVTTARAVAGGGARGDAERLGRELAAADRAMTRLAVQRAESEDDLSAAAWDQAARELKQKRAGLERQLAAASREVSAASRDPLPALGGIMEAWDLLPAADLNKILRTVVRHVVVWRDGPPARDRRGHFLPPAARVEVVPRWGPGG